MLLPKCNITSMVFNFFCAIHFTVFLLTLDFIFRLDVNSFNSPISSIHCWQRSLVNSNGIFSNLSKFSAIVCRLGCTNGEGLRKNSHGKVCRSCFRTSVVNFSVAIQYGLRSSGNSEKKYADFLPVFDAMKAQIRKNKCDSGRQDHHKIQTED